MVASFPDVRVLDGELFDRVVCSAALDRAMLLCHRLGFAG
jgi:hypothetical protein